MVHQKLALNLKKAYATYIYKSPAASMSISPADPAATLGFTVPPGACARFLPISRFKRPMPFSLFHSTARNATNAVNIAIASVIVYMNVEKGVFANGAFTSFRIPGEVRGGADAEVSVDTSKMDALLSCCMD